MSDPEAEMFRTFGMNPCQVSSPSQTEVFSVTKTSDAFTNLSWVESECVARAQITFQMLTLVQNITNVTNAASLNRRWDKAWISKYIPR